MTVRTKTGAVTRTPMYLGGCLLSLHGPEHMVGDAAVGAVLCPAFGQEEICTHHGLAELADELAAAGVPTVRLEYRGTGNSAGVERGELSLSSMVEDAARAAEYLRSCVGACSVVMVGVRMGAMVALRSLQRIPAVHSVVLMAPVLSGAGYLRETRAAAAVARLASLDPVPPVDSGKPLNTNGFHWSGALQAEVQSTELTGMDAPAVPVLFLTPPLDRKSGKLAVRWRNGNAAVTEMQFADYGSWMQDPTTHQTPRQSFRRLVQWVTEQAHAEGAAAPDCPVAATMLRTGGCMEMPVHFGEQNSLFGILSLPADGGASPIAALLLHEGSSHTIGNGGAYVTLARRLAAEGIASLRYDLSATGDSPANGNVRHPHYDLERIPESIAALDRLEELGYPMAVVFGLCAGGYTAFQVTLADKRVVGNVITNIQKFTWKYGADIRVQHRDNKRSLKGYLRAMRSRGEWKRALTGKGDIKGVMRVLLKRAVSQTAHSVKGLLPPAPDSEMATVHRQFRALAERRVHTNLLFSDDDPGLAEMWMQFGRRARKLGQFSPARMIVMEEADHHFNGTSARTRYFDLTVSLMKDVLLEHGQRAAEGADAERRARRRKERPSRISKIRPGWTPQRTA